MDNFNKRGVTMLRRNKGGLLQSVSLGSEKDGSSQPPVAAIVPLVESAPPKDDVTPPSSFWQAVIELVVNTMGTGVLCLPYLAKNAGVLITVAFILFYALLSTFSHWMLIAASAEKIISMREVAAHMDAAAVLTDDVPATISSLRVPSTEDEKIAKQYKEFREGPLAVLIEDSCMKKLFKILFCILFFVCILSYLMVLQTYMSEYFNFSLEFLKVTDTYSHFIPYATCAVTVVILAWLCIYSTYFDKTIFPFFKSAAFACVVFLIGAIVILCALQWPGISLGIPASSILYTDISVFHKFMVFAGSLGGTIATAYLNQTAAIRIVLGVKNDPTSKALRASDVFHTRRMRVCMTTTAIVTICYIAIVLTAYPAFGDLTKDNVLGNFPMFNEVGIANLSPIVARCLSAFATIVACSIFVQAFAGTAVSMFVGNNQPTAAPSLEAGGVDVKLTITQEEAAAKALPPANNENYMALCAFLVIVVGMCVVQLCNSVGIPLGTMMGVAGSLCASFVMFFYPTIVFYDHVMTQLENVVERDIRLSPSTESALDGPLKVRFGCSLALVYLGEILVTLAWLDLLVFGMIYAIIY